MINEQAMNKAKHFKMPLMFLNVHDIASVKHVNNVAFLMLCETTSGLIFSTHFEPNTKNLGV